MHGEEREIFVGIARGIAPAYKFGGECLLEQGVPLRTEHVIIVARAPPLGEERYGFRHQEPVHAGLRNLDRGVMRKDKINQPPVGLIDRYRQLVGLQFRKRCFP